MSNIDKRGLREAAEKATKGRWAVEFDDEIYSTDGVNHEQIAMVFSENEARDAAFIAAANPTTVLAMLDELEAAENNLIDSECHVAELEEALRDKQALLEALDNSLCEILPGTQYMDPPDGGSVTPLEQVRRMVADYQDRIAVLSASHSKLRDTMATIHNTIRMDGGYTPLAAILNAAKRAYEESATAAGIKGE